MHNSSYSLSNLGQQFTLNYDWKNIFVPHPVKWSAMQINKIVFIDRQWGRKVTKTFCFLVFKVYSETSEHQHTFLKSGYATALELWHLKPIPCRPPHGKSCVSFVHNTRTWLMVVVVIHHCCARQLLGWNALSTNLSVWAFFQKYFSGFSLGHGSQKEGNQHIIIIKKDMNFTPTFKCTDLL